MEAGRSSVKVVGTIVDGEAVFLSVQFELAVADAVSVASNECGEERLGRSHTVINTIMSLNHIGKTTIAVRDHDGHERAAIVRDGDFHAVGVVEEEEVCFFSLNLLLKV